MASLFGVMRFPPGYLQGFKYNNEIVVKRQAPENTDFWQAFL